MTILRLILSTFAMSALVPALAQAGSFSVLANFGPIAAGGPSGAFEPDGTGALIGVDHGSLKVNSHGELVRFVPPATPGQPWSTNIIYVFGGGIDGSYPQGQLQADGTGGFIGATFNGGAFNEGVAFRVAPPASGTGPWTKTVIYNFHGGSTDVGGVHGDWVVDAQGNLYGTSSHGGPGNLGGVFELTPPASSGGAWTETALAFFGVNPGDGKGPVALALTNAGIYVSLLAGGSKNWGQIVEITPPESGTGAWSTTVIHDFGRVAGNGVLDGHNPIMVHVDGSGNLYGTTRFGGTNGKGVYYTITNTGGAWNEAVAYTFTTGAQEPGDLVALGDGTLLGNSKAGGTSGAGTIFQLVTNNGVVTENDLYDFSGAADGATPTSRLQADGNGGYYGTTPHGGEKNRGVLYDFTP